MTKVFRQGKNMTDAPPGVGLFVGTFIGLIMWFVIILIIRACV